MRTLLGAASIAAALAVVGIAPARAQVAPHLSPGEAEALFRVANEQCLRGEAARCIDAYQRLVSEGYGGRDLYYNLGTAELRQGKLGPAVLHLERALRADPNDADARANLERAQRMRVDRLVGASAEVGGEEPFWTRLAGHTQRGVWALAALVLWTGGWLLLVTRRFWTRGSLRLWTLVAGLGAVAVSLPCGVITAAHRYTLEEAHEAVVVADVLPVREGPAQDLKPGFEIHEGLKVRVLEQEGGYKRVRLSNGLQGWVPAEGVVEIEG